MEFSIKTDKQGELLTLYPCGEINVITSQDLYDAVEGNKAGVKEIIFDFAECEYVSSAGIRVILASIKEMRAIGGDVKLRNVGEVFMEVLVNIGLDAVFKII